jgi:Cu(I)/Ag(I) efflux system protein CusF
MTHIRILFAAFLLGSAFTLQAAAVDAHHQKTQSQPAATAATGLAQGEVRKFDKETGKVTIKHGPLANLDMPAMTMVFRVKDPAMLNQLKAGDKINFAADKIDGAYTVMRVETVK